MDDRVKQYLFDIENCIANIERFMEQIASYTDFEANILVRRAVERELEIIGEAMNRILKIEENIGITDTQRIVDTRNKIIHGYDEVDEAVIYSIVKKSIPKLKEELEQL